MSIYLVIENDSRQGGGVYVRAFDSLHKARKLMNQWFNEDMKDIIERKQKIVGKSKAKWSCYIETGEGDIDIGIEGTEVE